MADAITSFGLWVRRRRRALDMTQDDLAVLVGCSKDLIVKIEGDARRPSKQMADLLGRALQIAPPEHDLFVRAARAELAPDRLPDPTRSVPQPTLSVPTVSTATPALVLPLFPSGTVTFLFTDIEGSTRRWEEQPDAMRVALARHDVLLRQAIEANGGRVFKTMGDAFCTAFAAAPDALAAAVAGQRALAAQDWGSIGALRVRMAVHTDTAVPQAGDYLGQPLNRVARLLNAGHGGQIVLSLATHELVRDHLPDGASLRDLGSHRFKDLVRPEPIFQLCTADLPTDFPALKSLDLRTTNLPVQVNALIGRTHAVAQVRELVSRTRLVTLTGPGGMGKTRLALHVGAELVDQYPDGVWFIDLAPLSDPDQLAAAIAQALGIPEASGRPIRERVFGWLQQRQLLLLLDNCEQVIDGVASLVAEVLGSTTYVQILATSRIPLRIAAEQEYPVLPLDLPNPQALPTFDQLSQYDAVALFIARAQAIRPDFMITNANAPAVAEICARLDGLPLAIELAAVRIRLFPPEQLLRRLGSRRMQTLTGGARDLPARQQTMRATIDWSYRLLTPPQQRLFMRLGVFVGGWTLEAAEAVAGEARLDVAEGLQVLVEHSLVRVVETQTTQRFILLETLHEYALERLAEAEEATETRQRHAAYFVALVETVGPAFGGPQHAMVRDQLDTELPNIRAAFAWFQEVGDHELALHFASALLGFWLQHGHGEREGREMLRAALSPPGAGPPLVRARALSALGRLSLFESESWPETIAALEESLAIFRELGDLGGSAEVLDHLHLIASYGGDTARAKTLIEESLRDSRRAGNPERLAWALANAADHAFKSGDDARGHALLDESLNVFAELKHTLGQGYVLFGRAAVTQQRGDNRRALVLFAESVGILRELGPTSMLGIVLFCHGQALLWEGDYAQAVLLLQESLAVHGTVNGYEGDSLVLNTLGEAALAQGDHAAARARFRESQVFSHKMGDTWYSAAAHLGAGHVALDEGNTKEATTCYTESLTIFTSLPDWDDQRRRLGVVSALAALTGAVARIAPERTAHLHVAVAALRASIGNTLAGGPFQLPSSRIADEQALATCRAALGDEAFDAAWADGKTLTLDQAITETLALGKLDPRAVGGVG